ncbi:MAG: hypothetical protein ACK5MQ_08745, partial [Pikeienuella sp.]
MMPVGAATGRVAGAVCGLLIAGGIAWWLLREPPSTPEQAAAPEQEAEPEPEAPPAAAPETATDAATAEEPRPGPAGEAPALDIVRIEPDGAGLVAGRAQPHAEVEILIDGQVVGAVRAGADGGFVAMINASPAPDQAQKVVARLKAGDAPEAEAPEETAEEPAPDAPAGVSDPVFIVGAGEAETPLVLRPEASGLSVLQGPERGEADGVALDAITYDAEGQVVLRGRAPEGSTVRIYLDRRMAGEVEIDA